MKLLLRTLISIVLIAYPLLVWWLAQQGLTDGLLLILLAVLVSQVAIQGIKNPRSWVSAAVLIVVAITFLFTDQLTSVLLYPVWMNAAMLIVFLLSLRFKPAVITRLARLMEGELSEKAVAYTEKVTWVWVGFFMVNGAISLFTVLHGDMDIWTLYNGFIAYVLMGLLFIIEWSVRRVVKDKH
ncbi:hypothetical protein [Idiomarina piscisalsi]|uniref:DNA gyrase subunit B n=1 Tax=Idiomarina piscisalsi TaxID=1096243 RepID=A0A432YS15_9GAMM|nr:hypothetical protein [Idiomarina piscisalsi]RUO64465.1 hypothetical protein CWI73_07160 [Idiomarina piscisalsi]